MAREDKRGEVGVDALADEATLLKKRARRRLIGAAALALLAAIVLPMVMDHQPAPPSRDIQVRIPSPDEGAAQRSVTRSIPPAPAKVEKVAAMPADTPAAKLPPKEEAASPAQPIKPTEKVETRPVEAKSTAKVEPKPETKPESKPEPKSETKPEPKQEVKPETKTESVATKTGDEAWEVQLGAYQEPGRVKLLVDKLKELGVPTYTEKVETPNGPRTRVRAGPFGSKDEAEKARVRVKIIGVDGPVAKKP